MYVLYGLSTHLLNLETNYLLGNQASETARYLYTVVTSYNDNLKVSIYVSKNVMSDRNDL
jgi:hypothetical protein